MSETITQGFHNRIAAALEQLPAYGDQPIRQQALAAFLKPGLPGPKTEEYRFTPITRNLEKHFKPEEFVPTTDRTTPAIYSIDQWLIPGYESNLIVFVNGIFSETLSRIISPSEVLTIQPLTDASATAHGASEYFNTIAPASEDVFTALNTALWQSGLLIRVPENSKVEKPIFILHLSDAGAANAVNQTRLLVVLGKGSEVTVTEKFNTVGDHAVFYSTVEEFEVGERATLNYHRIQNDEGQVYQTGTTGIRQRDASRVNTFTLTLDGQLIRNNLTIRVDGEGCESHFNGLYLLQKNTLADNHTVVDHLKPNSFSNELYKGIMDGTSKGVFNGKIYVRPHAQKTNAFQSNRNILLSENATVNTKPQLEIWADDVKCSHGCTSGQLDEEAIFYLRSRGISRHTARAMVLYAFAGEVLNGIKDPVLKSYCDQLVSERLLKNF